MSSRRIKENIPHNSTLCKCCIQTNILKCKRKLNFTVESNENNVMAPVSKTRESLNINEILENTNPDKLIQFIRAKSKRPVKKNIFCDPTYNSPSNRLSFPIQVEVKKPVKVAKKAPADASGDSSSDDDSQENENSPKIANEIRSPSKVSTQQNKNSPKIANKIRSPSKVNTNDRKKIDDMQRSNKKSMLPRPLAKLPSSIVARRALCKTFDDIHNGGVSFLPSAASTPVQRFIPDDPFVSTISNINANSSENTEENVPEGNGQPEIERNTELSKKPNNDTVSNRNHDQILAQPQRRITLNRTHIYNESMEIEESRPGRKSSRLSLAQPNKNKTVQDEDNQLEETLINNVSQHSTLKGSVQQPVENNPPEGSNANEEPADEETLIDVLVSSTTPVQQQKENLSSQPACIIQDNETRQSSDSRRQSSDSRRQSSDSRRQSSDRPINTNRSNTVPNHHRSFSRRSSRSSVRSQDPPNAHQVNLNRSSNVKSLDNIISAMCAKVRKSFEQQPILAPPTPFRSDHPPDPRDQSITIPPTQSQSFPVNCPTSPLVIIPMFAPGHCNQTHSITQPENSHVKQIQNGSKAHVNFDTVSHLGNENRRSILLSKRNSDAKRSHLKVSFPSDNAQIRSPSASPTKIHHSQQNRSPEIDVTSNKSKNVGSSTKNSDSTVHRANLSSKPIQRRTENESRAAGCQVEQSRLTAYENAQTSRHSRLPTKGKNIDYSLLEFQVTSDESNNISSPTREQNTVQGDVRESEEFLARNEPVEAIDLRLSCRRSTNFKEFPNTVEDSHLVGQKLSVPGPSSISRLSSKIGNSESSEMSLSGILRLDDMLKNLNNSGCEKSTEPQIVSRNATPSPHCVDSTIPHCVDSTTSNRMNGLVEEFNEDIFDTVIAEAATLGGYVYDMSPQTGKRWINSFIRNRPKARIAGSKRGHRVISSNSPSLHAVTYNDIELSILRKNKSKSRSSRISQRRLYSKGNSMEENSSDEDDSQRNNTTIQNISCKSRLVTCDKKSKIIKPAKRPVPMKFYTIKERVQKWDCVALSAPNNEQIAEDDQFVLRVNTDDDENLFKVPQPLSMKRKIVPQKIQNIKRQKINVLAVSQPERSQTEEVHNSDSGHSMTSVSTIRSSRSIHTQTTDDTTPSKTKAAIHTPEVDTSRKIRKKQRDNSEYQEKICQSETREPSPPLSNRSDPHESADERPAEPEVTSEIDSSYAVISRKTKTPKSAKVHRKSNVISSKDDSTARGMVLIDWPSDNDRLSPANSEQMGNAEHPEMLSEKPVNSSKDQHTNESNSNLLSKKKSNRGRKKNSMKNTVSSKARSILSPKSISNNDTTTGSLSLRRSSRKRAPPKPYWTFRRDDYELAEFTYKEPVPIKKTGTKKKRKTTRQNLEAIAEQSHMQAPVQSSDVLTDTDNPPSTSGVDQADDLFQAIKEMSINNGHMIEPTTSKARKKIGRKQPPKKPTSQSESDAPTNVTERTILTDSGMATDTQNRPNKLQRTSGDFLLSWLKNLIEPTAISSNPDLSRILRESAITVVPAQSLEFHSIDGVDYAYYSSSSSGNYGYMRFHPQISKPLQRLKRFELRLLNIFGVLHMKTEKGILVLRNGDFVTVPKGERYAIANKSDKNALLFYIKVETT